MSHTTSLRARRRLRSAGSLTTVLLAGALLAGCGDVAEQAAQEAAEQAAEEAIEEGASPDAEVDIEADDEGMSMSIEGEDMSIQVGEAAEIPENFPDSVPLPAVDYTVRSVFESNQRFQVRLLVAGTDVDALAEGLARGLTDNGYTVELRKSSSTGETGLVDLSATNGHKRVGVMLARAASGSEDRIVVTYVVTPAQSP